MQGMKSVKYEEFLQEWIPFRQEAKEITKYLAGGGYEYRGVFGSEKHILRPRYI